MGTVQQGSKPEKFLPKAPGCITLVMQVNLNVTKSLTRQPSDSVNVLGQIFFFRVEERVLGGLAFKVVMPRRDYWVVVDPCAHTTTLYLEITSSPGRLEMIGECEVDITRALAVRLAP
jgi:hypothetical protein